MPSKVLLINPSYSASYGGSKTSIVNPVAPTLGLATIAATALERGHDVEILDMSWRPYNFKLVRDYILKKKPNIIGITATTPLMNQLRDMSVLIKDISKDIIVVGGGAHPSALPEETLHESMLDAVFVGEADYSFADICDGKDFSKIEGLVYRGKSGEIFSTGLRTPIENLDDLPMPAWHLYNIKDYYRMSRLLARRLPIVMTEFSRGCVYKCDFCASKITLALGYRKKSPKRCAEEVKHMYSLGFREFWLTDDIFTSDQKWAKKVCDAITETDVYMTWTCTNGIRVESADDDLFKSLRKSGCYRVAFGFESGNDAVLKSFGKGGRATIKQAKKAVELARKSGIETIGYFLVGLSADTEESMNDTVEFARKLPLDMMKSGVAIAFPGTKMFNNYVDKGLIRSFDWDEYMIFSDKDLFSHEKLSFKTIQDYMTKFFRRCILFNPRFILRRLIRGIKTGEFFWDVYYAIKFYTLPATASLITSEYYSREKWPTYDFDKKPPKPAKYQTVRKTNIKAQNKSEIRV